MPVRSAEKGATSGRSKKVLCASHSLFAFAAQSVFLPHALADGTADALNSFGSAFAAVEVGKGGASDGAGVPTPFVLLASVWLLDP